MTSQPPFVVSSHSHRCVRVNEYCPGFYLNSYILNIFNTINCVVESHTILVYLLGGCPFNGPLSGIKYPTRESPRRDAASPIKYNALRVPQPSS